MLAEFNIVPIGSGESMGDQIAAVLKIVDESGLPYKANAMSTVVEGGWDEITGLVKRCHEEVLKKAKSFDLTKEGIDKADKWREILENLKPEDFGKYKV